MNVWGENPSHFQAQIVSTESSSGVFFHWGAKRIWPPAEGAPIRSQPPVSPPPLHVTPSQKQRFGGSQCAPGRDVLYSTVMFMGRKAGGGGLEPFSDSWLSWLAHECTLFSLKKASNFQLLIKGLKHSCVQWRSLQPHLSSSQP